MKVENPYTKEEIDFKLVTNLTQLLKFKALAKLLKSGLPDDKEDRDYFLCLLKACDTTCLAVKKLEGDIELATAQVETFNLVTSTLNKITKNPFTEENISSDSIDIPVFEREEGEDLIGLDDIGEKILSKGN